MSRASPVLVVDDDSDIRDAMRYLLTGDGYEMVEAADGQAALDYLRNHPPPAVVLLDWNMAPMNARQFMAQLGAEASLPRVPVLLLTADAKASEKIQGLGIAGFLRKPVDVDALLAAVGRYCQPS